MSLKDMLRSLENIYESTGGSGDKKENAKPVDKFTRLRREITEDLKGLRNEIAKRDKMLQVGQDAKTAAKSQEIRNETKRIWDKQQQLAEEYAVLEKKNTAAGSGTAAVSADEMRVRKQLVDTLRKHLEDAEDRDKRGFTGSRDELFGQLMPGGMNMVTKVQPVQSMNGDVELSELPAEFQAQMQELDQQEDQINEQLDRMMGTLDQLKEIAVEMKSEIQRQDVIIEDLKDNTDKQTVTLKGLNRRLKEILKDEKCGAQRFIIWIVLLVILLSLAAVIWRLVVASQ